MIYVLNSEYLLVNKSSVNILQQHSSTMGIGHMTTCLKATRSTNGAKMTKYDLCLKLAQQSSLSAMKLSLQPEYLPNRLFNVNLDY